MKFSSFKIGVAVTVTAISVLFGACKNYLDVKPESAFSPDDVFSNVSSVNSAIMGVYQLLAGDDGYGQRQAIVFPNDTDEFSRSGDVDAGARGLARYVADGGNSELAATFIREYNGIERANLCIKYIPLMPAYNNGSAADKKELRRMYAEALALRAIYYFELVKNWGDVPLQTEPSVSGMDFNLPKVNSEVVYDQILADLLIAERLLPWRKEVTIDERLTQGAARGMRARIALFRGGYMLRRSSNLMERLPDYIKYYTITRDECDTIMKSGQHTLNPSFYDVFKKLNELVLDNSYGERMLEVAQAGGNANYDSKLGRANGTRIADGSRYGPGGGAQNPTPSYFYAFDPADPRRDVTIANYNIDINNLKSPARMTEMNDGKYRRDWRPIIAGATQTLGINWVMLRYSDILLMYAEAVNEINGAPDASAIKAFEDVRKRAFAGNLSKVGVTPTDKIGFFNALVKERSFELGGEGIRKYDLIRWNSLGAKLQDAKTAMTAIVNTTTKYARYLYYRNVGEEFEFYPGTGYYLPDPAVAPTPLYNATTNPTGYIRVDWRQNLTTTAGGFIEKLGRSFKSNHSEVLPIHKSITDLNPNLKQDYGY
ncbi:RagB/SusD family nutrient uptake outer membrane protein [Pedobacter sp. MC2016-24]|uniref:RagB/SusD family nutrient uptake outer membrane protein n=1 Tax=Pedobacter sp. MC2016-24 TaxID=2780090 RepID=UPI001880A6A2|nr:RagB/SusD family nutrient uptake outer membrane protein [Pedobacter sp. MC2016-24]MBE9598611.1 RagB/SusD family nutrient uptake outer membrane protein [Pedobacter sp. MC2016-24]